MRDQAKDGDSLVAQGHIPEFDAEALAAGTQGLKNLGRNEHSVFHEEGAERAWKITKPGEYGARGSLLDYLTRHQDNNDTFEDDIRLEGAVRDPHTGKLSIIVSQPWIANAHPSTREEIEAYFNAKNFHRYSDRSFYHAGKEMLVSDAEPGNLLTANGVVHSIDVIPEHPSAARIDMIENVVRLAGC